MKLHHSNTLTALARRVALALLLGAVLLGSAACTGSSSRENAKDRAAAIEQLQDRLTQLEAGNAGVVFWQSVSAVLFVLAAFAFVGGAALGSRARRDSARYFGQPSDDEPHRSPDRNAA